MRLCITTNRKEDLVTLKKWLKKMKMLNNKESLKQRDL